MYDCKRCRRWRTGERCWGKLITSLGSCWNLIMFGDVNDFFTLYSVKLSSIDSNVLRVLDWNLEDEKRIERSDKMTMLFDLELLRLYFFSPLCPASLRCRRRLPNSFQPLHSVIFKNRKNKVCLRDSKVFFPAEQKKRRKVLFFSIILLFLHLDTEWSHVHIKLL